MRIEQEILDYYARGDEHVRLTAGPSLELIRTKVLLQRYLPGAPSRVLDVGGGSGVHARWLIELGYDVHLVDPVALHVEQASAVEGLTAELGDARNLAQADDSVDAVLLLGPLYHLTEQDDRVRALAEARRVVRPGGVVLAVAISRYASTMEGFLRSHLDRPGFAAAMVDDLATGQHRNPDVVPERFTTAYFHHVDTLVDDVERSGLQLDTVLPIEGPLHWAPGLAARLADPEQLALILDVLDTIEQDPSMTAATSHLLAVALK